MIGSITIVFWPPGVLTTWCTLNRFEHVKFLPKFKSQRQVNGTDNLFLVFDYLLSLTRLHRLFLRGIKSFRDLFRLSDDNPKNLFFFPAAPNRKYNKYAIEFEAPEARMKDKQCNYCVLCKSLQKPWREGTNAYRSRTSPIATERCFLKWRHLFSSPQSCEIAACISCTYFLLPPISRATKAGLVSLKEKKML